MLTLHGQVALVTRASRGVGRGVALGLANAGATVYATGRSIQDADLGTAVIAVPCDHTDDALAIGRRVESGWQRREVRAIRCLGRCYCAPFAGTLPTISRC